MKKEDKILIHIKLNQDEIIRYRRDILMLELEILRILKTIDNYKKLRESELDKKSEMKKSLKEVNNSIRTLKTKILPKIELINKEKIEQLPEKKPKEKVNKKKTVKKISYKSSKKEENDLDSELVRIQEELKKLQ